jgi:HK97 family phage portal protein
MPDDYSDDFGLPMITKSMAQAGWIMLGENGAYYTGGRHVASDGELLAEYLTNDVFYAVVDVTAMAVSQVKWKLFTRAGSETAKRYHTVPLEIEAARHVEKSLRYQSRVARKALQVSGGNENAEKLALSQRIEEITDHPLLDLMYADNDGLSATALRYACALYFEVFGGTYLHLETGKLGIPRALKVLPTYRIRAYRKNESDVVAYLYYPLVAQPSLQTIIPSDEVLSYRLAAPHDPYAGRNAPGRSAFDALELCGKYLRYQNTLLDNRARPDGVFIPDDKLPMNKDKARRAEETFNSKFGGKGSGRTLIAEQAGTYVPLSFSPQDIGELKINQEGLRRVCNAFGVPEALLAKDSTYSNQTAAQHWHAQNTVLPRVMMIEEAWNRDLVRRFGENLFLAAENPVPRDEALALQRASAAIAAGVLTRNETRVALGFDKVETLAADEMPWNVREAADAITQTGLSDEGEPPLAPSHGAAPETMQDITPETKGLADWNDPSPSLPHAGRWILRVNRQVARGELERSVAIALVGKCLGIDDITAKNYVGHAADPVRKKAEAQLLPGVAQKPASLPEAGILPAAGKIPAAAEILQPRIRAYFAEQHNAWGALGDWLPKSDGLTHDDEALAALLLLLWEQTMSEELGGVAQRLALTAAQESQVQQRAHDQAKREAAAYAALINQTTFSRMRSALEAAKQTAPPATGTTGEPGTTEESSAVEAATAKAAEEAANAIFAEAENERSITIALDQAYRAKMALNELAATEAGDVLEKMWITAGDEKVCPYCGQLDQQVAPVGGKFETALGVFATPPAHVNCRCWLMFIRTDGSILGSE